MKAKTCANCEHAILNKVWGEYKCLYYQVVVVDGVEDCDDFKKREGELQFSKDDVYFDEEAEDVQ